MRPQNSGGFTLIELLVALGIGAVMAGFLFGIEAQVGSGQQARREAAGASAALDRAGLALQRDFFALVERDPANDKLPKDLPPFQADLVRLTEGGSFSLSWGGTGRLTGFDSGSNLQRIIWAMVEEDRSQGGDVRYRLVRRTLPMAWEGIQTPPEETVLTGLTGGQVEFYKSGSATPQPNWDNQTGVAAPVGLRLTLWFQGGSQVLAVSR
ncbi:MAG: hypothetical protein COX57_02715 [Alphaproteobacteria bacterium CG_4_10_14_0_2_um_filter_63_37]|nr:MAG: hypothetical protein COX57_02715 [Alphaproteobacteria bacterium CG_4_10_14_0_2_um_filter_63_37]